MVQTRKSSHRKRNFIIGIGAVVALVGLGIWAINRHIDIDLFDTNEDVGIGA